ncbi:hypothetical protein [Neobacillus sp.]|uniref:hypothetical protein n=1 Tax=Neobacillus sp. TaxID=2675273 RepID=UPI00289F2347|nr:hypothetical protein [Neobacillus sp.]
MSLIKSNLGQNISTAVEVLIETYKNLDSLFVELDRIGEEEGFLTLTPRFMRWKSDSDPAGWLTSNFIKLYQLEKDPDFSNNLGLKSGSLFGVEVDLLTNEYPVISLIRYTFDYSHWTKLPSISDHWIFFGPFRYDNFFNIYEEDGLWSSEPLDKAKKRYWGIQRAVARQIPLVEITTPESIRTKIFQELDQLPI